MDQATGEATSYQPTLHWPAEGNARVPYRVFSDPEIYREELSRIFLGPTWQFLTLASQLPSPGDYLTTFLGETPVIVTRGHDGEIHAMLNRCAHRGNLVCLKRRGRAEDLTCVYHAWRYDLEGNLKSVAFRRGVAGQGGMPESFRLDQHGLKKLRGKAVLRPVACDQVRGARGRGQGTETVAQLGGLPPSVACVSQRLDA